ncbi:eosinophil peroxidase-like [Solea senegalensis]|uniref:Eosinophil peroxidase-like n=1 Tax=Solea senegalensis TaxID=28829 RepID=A0AAV6T2R2_SOLSE|nr:eosinophil peroxidase-like [Solea senegalensis]
MCENTCSQRYVDPKTDSSASAMSQRQLNFSGAGAQQESRGTKASSRSRHKSSAFTVTVHSSHTHIGLHLYSRERMSTSLFLLMMTAGLDLSTRCLADAESRLNVRDIEAAVLAAKAAVDDAYKFSRHESLARVRRNAVNPSNVMRLVKQPIGASRTAVRAADYMHVAVKLFRDSLKRRHKRSINATDLISEEHLQVIADLTGCTPRHRAPSCKMTPGMEEYRTASGACNNRKNTRWGSANTPFARWLPAEYQDKISLPKGWDPTMKVNCHRLPMVREVSNRIMKTASVESDPLYTQMVSVFGQWVDHDITLTPQSPVIRSFSNGINCDSSCECTEPCFPIKIPWDDPRYHENSEECMAFFRSAAACGSGNTGHFFGDSTIRQQMNAVTSFIDASQVYGSDDLKTRFLRNMTKDQGLLKHNRVYKDNGREHLPFLGMTTNMCATRGRIMNDPNLEEVPCFLVGDQRGSENIGLVTIHSLMSREHNRLVHALAKLNPHWKGERLYHEARKIMGAYFQILTFRDYLPLIVGSDMFNKLLSTYPGYDENVDPSIANVFATAAFRFGHTTFQPFMFRLDEEYKEHKDYPSPPLHKSLFTPWRIIFEGGVDPVLRGLVGRQAKLNSQDHMMSDEMREKLFKFSSKLAQDLSSLNMQRGRDHGLPGYNDWRRFCDLSPAKDLAELTSVMQNADLAVELLDLYGTPDNIDLWLGGIIEPFVPGGRVGPLFACLIATQFQRIRQGDRLWWENEGVFTKAQKKSLKDTSLSRIICDNTGITDVPTNPFLYKPRGSGYTECTDIPAFDLSPWEEISEPMS